MHGKYLTFIEFVKVQETTLPRIALNVLTFTSNTLILSFSPLSESSSGGALW